MIKHENYKNNLVKTYSDNGVYIKQVQTGRIYDIAIDVKPLKYVYVETTKKIPENKIARR